MPWEDIAVAYVNDDKKNPGEKYIVVTLNKDMPRGSKLYLKKNKYKKEAKHPDYKYSVPNDEKTDEVSF